VRLVVKAKSSNPKFDFHAELAEFAKEAKTDGQTKDQKPKTEAPCPSV